MRNLIRLSIFSLSLALSAVLAPATTTAFPSFSLTPASPSSVALTPGGILDPATGAPIVGPQPAPVVALSDASLGLPPGANVNGISFGDDLPFWGPPVSYEFSVAPGAVGAPWLPGGVQNVAAQAAEGAVEGDIFIETAGVAPGGPACAFGANFNVQLYDADGANAVGPVPLGLGGLVDPPPPPAAAPYDDIDAYEARDVSAVDYRVSLTPGGTLGSDGLADGPVFFTVDAATAAGLPADPGGSGPITGGDVLVTDPYSPTGWVVYADAAMLGLAPADDIDALLVADSVMIGPGPGSVGPPPRFFGPHPTDFIAYSLTPASPSLGALPLICGGPNTGGDMWAVSPFFFGGGPVPWLAAEDLGLSSPRVGGPADDLDGIDIGWALVGDADADGLPDIVEGGACPGAIVGLTDTDGDGLTDGIEATMGGNPAGVCLPGGSFPDVALADSDFDGMDDAWEMAHWTFFCLATNASAPDAAFDFDGEGLPNGAEYMLGTDPCLIDSDGDGFLDVPATGHDGPNTIVAVDNCPVVFNPAQANTDAAPYPNGPNLTGDDATNPFSDALGDACDSDDDNDGITDADEASGAACGGIATNPLDRDTDGDHLTDSWECANGSDPTDATSKILGSPTGDTDGDHIQDVWESRRHGSNPVIADSDGDGCWDMVEVASVNGDNDVTDGDRLAVARRSLGIWGPDVDQDYVFDMDGNGNVGIEDRLFVARAALIWLPRLC